MAVKHTCPHCGGLFAAQGIKAHIAMKHKGATPPIRHRADQLAKSGVVEPVPSEPVAAVADEPETTPGAPIQERETIQEALDDIEDGRSDYEKEMGY